MAFALPATGRGFYLEGIAQLLCGLFVIGLSIALRDWNEGKYRALGQLPNRLTPALTAVWSQVSALLLLRLLQSVAIFYAVLCRHRRLGRELRQYCSSMRNVRHSVVMVLFWGSLILPAVAPLPSWFAKTITVPSATKSTIGTQVGLTRTPQNNTYSTTGIVSAFKLGEQLLRNKGSDEDIGFILQSEDVWAVIQAPSTTDTQAVAGEVYVVSKHDASCQHSKVTVNASTAVRAQYSCRQEVQKNPCATYTKSTCGDDGSEKLDVFFAAVPWKQQSVCVTLSTKQLSTGTPVYICDVTYSLRSVNATWIATGVKPCVLQNVLDLNTRNDIYNVTRLQAPMLELKLALVNAYRHILDLPDKVGKWTLQSLLQCVGSIFAVATTIRSVFIEEDSVGGTAGRSRSYDYSHTETRSGFNQHVFPYISWAYLVIAGVGMFLFLVEVSYVDTQRFWDEEQADPPAVPVDGGAAVDANGGFAVDAENGNQHGAPVANEHVNGGPPMVDADAVNGNGVEAVGGAVRPAEQAA